MTSHPSARDKMNTLLMDSLQQRPTAEPDWRDYAVWMEERIAHDFLCKPAVLDNLNPNALTPQQALGLIYALPELIPQKQQATRTNTPSAWKAYANWLERQIRAYSAAA